jgi:hypothetical protein
MIVDALGVDSLEALGRAIEGSGGTPGEGEVADIIFGGGDTLASDGAEAAEAADTLDGNEPETPNLAPFSSEGSRVGAGR